MFTKLGAFFTLLRKGNEVADPEKWKSRQITATVIGGLIIALINLAKAYGYEIPVTAEDANSLGVGIIALVNIVLTATTSKRAGVLPHKQEPVQDEPQSDVDPVQPQGNADYQKDYNDKDLYIG